MSDIRQQNGAGMSASGIPTSVCTFKKKSELKCN